ncbi:efflux RND transporter periplasmic adaptor subunit [Novosphingobium sp. BW1]|uniref:efflux RND transporter periplasmic adaptor subunit n=1 Tax=Novosphingobium sp. BW1 TaxID=2592621 RepID=UPI0011DE92E7|nr:efflux RND transporter periplasmic adaptor subunit [Novosphingobium sp. BW1]TYC90022.1 efflux RND transporter periplasmic adaptor subunit [Novosphingobium sp. BW1]
MNYTSKLDKDRAEVVSKGDLGAEAGADGTFEAQTPAQGPEKGSSRLIWLGVAGAFVLIVGIWFYLHSGADTGPVEPAQVPVVTVVKPGRSTVVGTITATGSLAARRAMPIGSVGEGGEVRRVLVEPGDWVKAGQVLAVVDSSVQVQQQASQAAQIKAAQADARLAQSNLDRALQLVDRGFISKADVDRLTATRDAALAQVELARASLRQLQAQAARLNIVAPAAGLVLERNVEPGQVVGGGSSVLFRLAKGGEMELLANLSEDDLARVRVGAQAEVTPVGSERSFTGQVWQVSPVIDPTSRQGTARIALAYDRALRPGGFASATLTSGTVVAPMLPESAIQSDAEGSFVYVVGKDNKVARRGVETGLVTADGIVISKGLAGTETVVLRAGGFLNPEDTVEPRMAKAAD